MIVTMDMENTKRKGKQWMVTVEYTGDCCNKYIGWLTITKAGVCHVEIPDLKKNFVVNCFNED